jgi:hypothetical protein
MSEFAYLLPSFYEFTTGCINQSLLDYNLNRLIAEFFLTRTRAHARAHTHTHTRARGICINMGRPGRRLNTRLGDHLRCTRTHNAQSAYETNV